MRTISVRLSLAEHRLLQDIAGARGISIETLVREAMALVPFEAPAGVGPHLQVVQGERAPTDSAGADADRKPPQPSR
jgi:hypothetical protein